MNGLIKRLLIFVAAMAVVAGAGWFGRKAYKHSLEHRLVTQAAAFSKTNDFRNAELCLRRALQVNPLSAPATRMVADMLEASGLPAAVGWRVRAAQLEPRNVTNRLAWAETAIKFKDLKSAEQALSEIHSPESNSTAYHQLAGALAYLNHQPVQAEAQFSAASVLEPANEAVAMNLATVRLGSTNQQTARLARVSLENLLHSPRHRIEALQILSQDAVTRKAWPDALGFAQQLASDPKAGFGQKLAYLQLLKTTTNAQFSPYLVTVKGEATNSPAQAFAFGRWMAASDGPGEALAWLQALPVQLQTNQPVPLIVTDCQIALKDWPSLLATINKRNWTEAEFYRCALESLAYRAQKKEYPSQAAWQKALHNSAHHLDRLSRLAQVAAGWGWQPETTEVLEKITSEFPEEKWAATSLMAQLYSAGNTSQLTELLRQRYASDPSDVLVKNNLANLYLLRKSELDQAYRLAREAHDKAPRDPFFASTYAYSLLLQHKNKEAVQVFDGLKPEYLKIPSVAAYYGIIQAEAGNKDQARAALQCASSAKLLPEETELVRLAKARL